MEDPVRSCRLASYFFILLHTVGWVAQLRFLETQTKVSVSSRRRRKPPSPKLVLAHALHPRPTYLCAVHVSYVIRAR